MYTKYNGSCADPGAVPGRSVNKMTTMVRMPIELKEQLEGMKERFGKKTIYDMVEHLIDTVERQKTRIGELQKEKEEQNANMEQHYIYLGEEMKKQFTEFQQHVDLKRPAAAVDFLISNFDSSLTMSRMAFDAYVRLKGGQG